MLGILKPVTILWYCASSEHSGAPFRRGNTEVAAMSPADPIVLNTILCQEHLGYLRALCVWYQSNFNFKKAWKSITHLYREFTLCFLFTQSFLQMLLIVCIYFWSISHLMTFVTSYSEQTGHKQQEALKPDDYLLCCYIIFFGYYYKAW